MLELPYEANNDSAIAQFCDSTVNVVMPGRTIYKDNGWNSLCLPFSLDSAELEASILAGCKLMEMDPTRSGVSDTTLTVTFVRTHHLVAGRPYFIKWDTAADIIQPYFPNVTVSNTVPVPVTSADGNLTFCGTYNQLYFPANAPDILVVSVLDTLSSIKKARVTGTCIAHFHLSDSIAFPRRIVFNVDYRDTPTAILGEPDDQPEKFFRNGVLYIRRRGLLYDVTGRLIRAK